MYKVFNMGHRMEVYCAPEHATAVIEVAERFGIAAQVTGRTEAADGANRLTLRHGEQWFNYGG